LLSGSGLASHTHNGDSDEHRKRSINLKPALATQKQRFIAELSWCPQICSTSNCWRESALENSRLGTGILFDLGLLYHRAPKATLTTTKAVPQLQSDINEKLQDVNNYIKDLKLFPIL
jgi:hypothetical protein